MISLWQYFKDVIFLRKLRNRFERFCFQHQKWGIPNLMLYITIANALVYLFCMVTKDLTLYYALCFDRGLILQGQVWRLFTYIFTLGYVDLSRSQTVIFDVFSTLLMLYCFFALGRAVESAMGTFKFNLYYLSGILMMDIFGMIFGGMSWLNLDGKFIFVQSDFSSLFSGNMAFFLYLSLVLCFSTLHPNAQFLLLYIIPIKAWVLAVVDLAFTLYDVIVLSIPYFYFPYNLFPLIAIANYFLFFGKDFVNVFPDSWRINARRLVRRGKQKVSRTEKPKVVPFPTAGAYQSSAAKAREAYTHKCTVCGRTDVSDPQLEFRYCSRCSGYHCYCQDHISNHSHIQ
jgi:hypothetical protein